MARSEREEKICNICGMKRRAREGKPQFNACDGHFLIHPSMWNMANDGDIWDNGMFKVSYKMYQKLLEKQHEISDRLPKAERQK